MNTPDYHKQEEQWEIDYCDDCNAPMYDCVCDIVEMPVSLKALLNYRQGKKDVIYK